MHCLKCGKETAEKQVFCDDCQAVMENYPVKPGTAVHLPRRDMPAQKKKTPPRHHEETSAEQIFRLRKTVRRLLFIVAALSLLLLLTAGMLLHLLLKEDASSAIGKNYTTVDTATQP